MIDPFLSTHQQLGTFSWSRLKLDGAFSCQCGIQWCLCSNCWRSACDIVIYGWKSTHSEEKSLKSEEYCFNFILSPPSCLISEVTFAFCSIFTRRWINSFDAVQSRTLKFFISGGWFALNPIVSSDAARLNFTYWYFRMSVSEIFCCHPNTMEVNAILLSDAQRIEKLSLKFSL